MYPSRKNVFYVVVTIVCFSSFSGCILYELFGTNFTLTSYNVCDDDGFPGLSLVFSSTGTVTVRLYNPDGSMLDSDLFFYGDHNAVLHLSSYKETVAPGGYRLKVYDKNEKEIFEKTFSLDGPDLSIVSCSPRWWKREAWKGGYSLIGVTMNVYNHGDTPVYPYTAEVFVDSKSYSGLVLPCVILPNESKRVDCFIYKEDTPEDNTFTVSLKDIPGDTLASDSSSIVLDDNVPVEEFTLTYDGRNRRIKIPYPEFLFNYYSGIDRILHEDYGVYVFDIYDDDYINLTVDQLMFGFHMESDVDKINLAASFVQNLEYKKDSEMNDSFEYPRYPVETIFNGDGGGDCEDLAILTASILDKMGYDVALLRLTGHMAVGVRLDDSNVSDYEYYTEDYYFLETTSIKPVGFIPNNYRSRSNLSVYPISSRPLLIHKWKNGNLTIFYKAEQADFVKVTLIVENLGSDTAGDILVKGAFYTQYDQEVIAGTEVISSLKPGLKKEITVTVDVPVDVTTWFKTRVYLNDEVVDEREAASSFP